MGLVVLGEQNRRELAAPFRDDPEFRAVRGVIDREQAGTFRQCGVIRRAVVRTTITPITVKVPGEGRRDLRGCECREGVGRDHELAQVELRSVHRLSGEDLVQLFTSQLFRLETFLFERVNPHVGELGQTRSDLVAGGTSSIVLVQHDQNQAVLIGALAD